MTAVRSLRNESVLFPGSHCDNCKTPLAWSEIIPIVSYLWQKGLCRHCKTKIPIDLWVTEIATGTLYFALYLRFKGTMVFVALLIPFSLLVLLSITDWIALEVFHIHLALLLFSIVFLSMLFPAYFSIHWTSSLAVVAGGTMIFFLSNGGIGSGDIKLASILSLSLSCCTTVRFLLYSIWSAGAVAVFLLLRGKHRKTKVPMVPFLALGYFLEILI